MENTAASFPYPGNDTVSNTLPSPSLRCADRESHLYPPQLPTLRALCSPAKSVLSSEESTLLTSDGNAAELSNGRGNLVTVLVG